MGQNGQIGELILVAAIYTWVFALLGLMAYNSLMLDDIASEVRTIKGEVAKVRIENLNPPIMRIPDPKQYIVPNGTNGAPVFNPTGGI